MGLLCCVCDKLHPGYDPEEVRLPEHSGGIFAALETSKAKHVDYAPSRTQTAHLHCAGDVLARLADKGHIHAEHSCYIPTITAQVIYQRPDGSNMTVQLNLEQRHMQTCIAAGSHVHPRVKHHLSMCYRGEGH